MEVYFSPHGGCTDAIVKQLDAARETVLVQAYTFTSAPIAKALMEAHKRGVKVQVILDKSQRTTREHVLRSWKRRSENLRKLFLDMPLLTDIMQT